jgi:hypothetical protein
MSRLIQSFRRKTYALFIDVEKGIAKVSVDVKNGDVMMTDEALGFAAPFAFPGSTCQGFQLTRRPGARRSEVSLVWGKAERYLIGQTTDEAAAQSWIDDANGIIRRAQAPTSTKPKTLPTKRPRTRAVKRGVLA